MDWNWVLGQIEGQKYWGNGNDYLYPIWFRRSNWPIINIEKGTVFPNSSGDYTVPKTFTKTWHVWLEVNSGYEKYASWMQGWGGSIGAEHKPEDYVLVNGDKLYDGVYYKQSDIDKSAIDWERVNK